MQQRFSLRRFSRLFLCLVCLFWPVPSATSWAETAYAATIEDLTLGYSTEGRPITAVRYGDGALKLVVIGDTHGGPEANTYVLATQLIDYFRSNPQEIPAQVRLYIIPTLNPDGLANQTRFNANFVDLNRNMNTNLDACPENDWSTTVQGAYGVVSDTGGPYPDSEVESRLIRSFLMDASAAIFLHSNAGLVFPAFCEHQPSIALAQIYAQGADYVYSRVWDKYFITGGMNDWAGSLGIASITPELVTGEDSEYPQNLAAMQAVLSQTDAFLFPPADHEEAGITIPAVIWRYWKANGGMERFGPPLAAATTRDGVTQQIFERAAIELRADQADTPDLVRTAPLGREAAAGEATEATVAQDGARFFSETGHNLAGNFLSYWNRYGGVEVFGLPLTETVEKVSSDGQRHTVQFFERAVLAEDADGTIQLEPIGQAALIRQGLNDPTLRRRIQ